MNQSNTKRSKENLDATSVSSYSQIARKSSALDTSNKSNKVINNRTQSNVNKDKSIKEIHRKSLPMNNKFQVQNTKISFSNNNEKLKDLTTFVLKKRNSNNVPSQKTLNQKKEEDQLDSEMKNIDISKVATRNEKSEHEENNYLDIVNFVESHQDGENNEIDWRNKQVNVVAICEKINGFSIHGNNTHDKEKSKKNSFVTFEGNSASKIINSLVSKEFLLKEKTPGLNIVKLQKKSITIFFKIKKNKVKMISSNSNNHIEMQTINRSKSTVNFLGINNQTSTKNLLSFESNSVIKSPNLKLRRNEELKCSKLRKFEELVNILNEKPSKDLFNKYESSNFENKLKEKNRTQISKEKLSFSKKTDVLMLIKSSNQSKNQILDKMKSDIKILKNKC